MVTSDEYKTHGHNNMLKEYFRFLCHVNDAGGLFCVDITTINTGLVRLGISTKQVWLQIQRTKSK